MELVDDLKMYARFGWGLRRYLKQEMTLDQAINIIQRRLAERETMFLRVVERAIYGYPRSPYLPLLKLARCEFGDIQALVRQHGVEETLKVLRQAGVYVTFEEFKGRAPLERQGQVFSVKASHFDNPYLVHYFQGQTGGSTGVGTRVSIDLEHLAAWLPHSLLAYATHDLSDAVTAIWRGVLPDDTGMSLILRLAAFGQLPRRWFTPITHQHTRPALKYRLATQMFVVLGRLYGTPIPWPEPVSFDQAIVIARWAEQAIQEHGKCVIRCGISMPLRICLAAQEAGIDLTGLTFMGGGEPATIGKTHTIEASGARLVPLYTTTEMGQVGIGCAHRAEPNDQHFMKDQLAVIQAPRRVPGANIMVDAFNFTTLSASNPKIMLNVESDDYGIIEERSCGCLLEKLGFTQHMLQIRSFRKLTGEGVTLIGSEMVRILEEVLPGRYGGTPLDYQLSEAEDEQGFTRLILVIHPRLTIPDEAQVIDTVMQALAQGSPSADLARAIWSQAKSLRVQRAEPSWTMRGKLNPLSLGQKRPPSSS